MTQANALQQHSILGQVYCSPAGQWGYRVFMNGVQVACNAGYDDEIETAEACCAVFPDIDFPVRVVEAVGFSFLPLPGSQPLPAHTCPQCLGAGYLDGAIECPNCFGHGELYCLDDLEVAE